MNIENPSIKKYVVDYDNKAEIVVEIDHSLATDDVFHKINNFWGGADDRLHETGGNIVTAVLKLLARAALYEEIISSNAIRELHGQGVCGGVEGWPKLDGSCGIKLVSVDCLDIDSADLTVTCNGESL